MSTLTEIRTELASALASSADLAGVNVYSQVPAQPSTPAAIVAHPDSMEFNATLAGHRQYVMRVILMVPMADVEAAQGQLDGLISGGLASDITSFTTDVWRSIEVESVVEFRTEPVSDTAQALACDLIINLIA